MVLEVAGSPEPFPQPQSLFVGQLSSVLQPRTGVNAGYVPMAFRAQHSHPCWGVYNMVPMET